MKDSAKIYLRTKERTNFSLTSVVSSSTIHSTQSEGVSRLRFERHFNHLHAVIQLP